MPPCLLLTRPEAESAAFAQAARAAGWRGDILCAPLMRILHDPPPETALTKARTLVVTSQHGVAALQQATARRDWPVWCVGPRTAEAARHAGFAQVRVADGDAVSLRAVLLDTSPPAPVLHLRGEHAAMDLASELQAAGVDAHALVVYRQVAQGLSQAAQERLAQGGDILLPVFSPRSARLLVAALIPLRLDAARLHLVAISAAARDAAQGVDWQSIHCAARPDAPSMLQALARLQATLEPLKKPR